VCILCTDYLRGRLTQEEAKRNFSEIRPTMDEEHAREVDKRLQDPFWEQTNKRSRQDRQRRK